VAFITAIGYSLVMTFLPADLLSRGMANAASLFFFIFAIAMTAIRLLAGRLHDHRGDNSVIPAALMFMALGLTTLALANNLWLILLAELLSGIGYGAVVPSLQACGINRTTIRRIPIATFTHYSTLDTGIAIGPVALVFMIPLAGYSGLYFAGTAIVILAALVYWFSHGRHAKHPKTLNSQLFSWGLFWCLLLWCRLFWLLLLWLFLFRLRSRLVLVFGLLALLLILVNVLVALFTLFRVVVLISRALFRIIIIRRLDVRTFFILSVPAAIGKPRECCTGCITAGTASIGR